MKESTQKKKSVAISAKNLQKRFVIPHEKVSTLRGAFVSMFNKKGTDEVFDALHDVSFDVYKGEFFGIIGKNGSGKSTLLKILAGIYTQDKGTIEVNGMISPFLELGIGFNPELSGRDNVYLNATVLGLSRKEIDEKFQSILQFSELERFIDQKIKNYSSGMQARLAFAVAIHANRDILLMDEVLAVGDSNFQQKCLDEFVRYREQGKTVILVSHDIDTIQKYCDRVLLLREGRVQKIGKPSQVYDLYLQQNMADVSELEEKEAELEEKTEKISEKKPKKPFITDVEIFNQDRDEANIIQTNEPLSIRVSFDTSHLPKDEPINVGIGIYNNIDAYILGYNTQMDKYDVTPGAQSVEIHFPALPLLQGQYKVNVVLFGHEERSFFDFKTHIVDFRVFPTVETSRYRGVVITEHEWSSLKSKS